MGFWSDLFGLPVKPTNKQRYDAFRTSIAKDVWERENDAKIEASKRYMNDLAEQNKNNKKLK